jgi:hypothetical protein
MIVFNFIAGKGLTMYVVRNVTHEGLLAITPGTCYFEDTSDKHTC